MNFDSSSIAGLPPAHQAFHGGNEVVTEQIDMSQVSVGALVPAELTVVTQDVFGQNPSQSLANPKEKTATVKLSKMPVAVDKRVFLDPEKAELYNGNPDLIIYGIVSVCPRKSNGNRYSMDWSAFELPAELDRTLLRATMPKEEVKGLLVEGKNLFLALAATGDAPKRSRRSRNKTSHSGGASRSVSIETPSRNVPAQVNTPASARAALLTAGNSSVSSLSGAASLSSRTTSSTRTQNTRPITRNQRGEAAEDSDSDEDRSNFDPEDNAYQVIDPLDDFYIAPEGQGELDEEDEDQEEEVIVGTAKAGSLSAHIANLEWECKQVAEAEVDDGYHRYTGEPCLRPGIAESFDCPSTCTEQVGGLTYRFVARLAANSNDYFVTYIEHTLDRNKRYHGLRWVDISTQEMYFFLGILLKISLAELDAGGYAAYFSNNNRSIHTGWHDEGRTKELFGTKGLLNNTCLLRASSKSVQRSTQRTRQPATAATSVTSSDMH